ncbi:MAG: phosphopantetheine-binding protein [Acidobacteriota bacterium]|nr:phosphopantetheine-binding protein [Acidobacteriota bacterium]
MAVDAQDIVQLTRLQLGLSGVRLEDRLLEDLHVSSLDLVNLTVAIEDRFGISIREEDAATLCTVADLHNLVGRLSGS